MIGVAWESGDNDVYNIVNSSIGLENNSLRELVRHVDSRLSRIKDLIVGQELEADTRQPLSRWKRETSKRHRTTQTYRPYQNQTAMADWPNLISPRNSTTPANRNLQL